MDRFALQGGAREAAVLAEFPALVGVVAGHYHRAIVQPFAGAVAVACPSTAVQLALRLGAGPTTYGMDLPGYALHEIVGATMRTHFGQLGDPDTWVPTWADD